MDADPTMTLPQSNARLTAVASAGGSENYDTPATPGASKFAGNTAALLQEKRERVTDQSGTNVIVRRSLIVPVPPVVEYAEGDVLTISYRGQSVTGTVQVIERREAPAGLPKSCRLTFELQ